VHFTDASNVSRTVIPPQGGGKTWDIMYVSIAKGLQGSRTDRLLRYKLETGELHLHLGKCIEGVLNK